MKTSLSDDGARKEENMVNAIKMNPTSSKSRSSFRNRIKTIGASAYGIVTAVAATIMQASAFGDSVTITATDADANNMMGNVIGILLTITRFVGVALAIYGVYEIVMSFMQNQPEAKTKGIVMALAGVVMIALKSVLQAMNIIGTPAA